MGRDRAVIYTCRGPAVRTSRERAISLRALAEVAQGLNIEAWKHRISMIYEIQKAMNPGRRYGGNMGGAYCDVQDIINGWGVDGVAKAWEMWKNERTGCGQWLDETIKGLEQDKLFMQGLYCLEAEAELGITYGYRTCPACGDKDPITIGRRPYTSWPQ